MESIAVSYNGRTIYLQAESPVGNLFWSDPTLVHVTLVDKFGDERIYSRFHSDLRVRAED